MSLIILAAQTLFFWLIGFFLYRVKSRATLIPLYAYLALLTVATHNISDFGFAVVRGDLLFLIGSVSFFTTILFIVFFLYLLEGSRAARIALWVILGASFFYIFVIYSLQFIVDTSNLVQLNSITARTYLWSISAIIIDVFALGIIWELFAKFKSLPLFFRVFFVSFLVLILDTLIFTTGVFVEKSSYIAILEGNLLTRLVLASLTSPVLTFLLKKEGFVEAKREKPQKFWEILNFRSDLEAKIYTLEETIKKNKSLEEKLKSASDTYELVIAGSGAGIWDWNVSTNQFIFSEKFLQILGYKSGSLKNTLEAFKAILHPADLKNYLKNMEHCFAEGVPCECEYRLKAKSGQYKWFSVNGIVKYNAQHQPVRVVGSIIDIDSKKHNEIKLKEKIEELSALNRLMVDREMKMIELKDKIKNSAKKI